MLSKAPLVIAHRGASGYLPEHSLAAKAMAHAMGADFLEQDVVLSRDGVPIVLHDVSLGPTTDVAQCFPGRQRRDGRFYAIDFELAELRQLRLRERIDSDSGQSVFPARFPQQSLPLGIATLAEEIAFITGMDHSRGRQTGLYIELKAPRFHLSEGQDIARVVLDVLTTSGYDQRPDQVFLQCFDDVALRYLKEELDCTLPLIQLIADKSWGEDSAVDYEHMRSPEGLRGVARYASGIGPWLMHLYQGRDAGGQTQLSTLVDDAHQAGLLVHPYTLRKDALPAGITCFEELLDLLLNRAGVDGVFTDFPDLVRDFIARG